MILEEYSKRFDAMSTEQKIRILAFMVMALTVETRSAVIDLPDEQAVNAYKGFNELQHSVANQLCAYSLSSSNIRPDDVFWQILEEVASRFLLKEHFFSAVSWSFSRNQPQR